METRAKKAKLSSVDPLEKVCSDVHDLILQHFNKEEVLIATEVSPVWNFAISNSSVAMAKIPLKFHAKAQIPNIISRSERKYNKLDVTINIFTRNVKKKIRLIEKFSPWLKDLALVILNNNVNLPQQLPFPMLETLKLCSIGTKILVNATNLKKLDYEVYQPTREVIDWIQNQKRLKVFALKCDENFLDFDPIAPKGVEDFTILLAKAMHKSQTLKLNNFLKPMCESLVALKLDHCFPENIELIVNNMPKLERFNSHYFAGDLSVLKLKPNESITLFKITALPNRDNFLRSLVNLEILSIFAFVNEFEFEWIPRNMKKLKALKIGSNFCYARIVARYEIMKTTEEDINKDIQIDQPKKHF
jgi:hypothetical protein